MPKSNHDESAGRRRWLCIAYAFPPINRSGTHRTLAFVRHLHRLGWDATVLTVEPRHETIDEELVYQVPESTSVIRTEWVDLIEWAKAFPWVTYRARPGANPEPRAPALDGAKQGQGSARAESASAQRQAISRAPRGLTPAQAGAAARNVREWVSRLLMTPDSRLGWIPSGVRAGLASIRRRRPEVIFSTSPYMSAHLIGLILSRWTGLPWVADFRDPWCDNPFRDLGFASLTRWDSLLERTVLRTAAHVVCCTPTMTEALCRRRPFIADKCTTILNGIDLEVISGIRPRRVAPAEAFVVLHCGQFYGPRSPGPWLSALGRVRRQSPETAARLRFALLGSDSYDGRRLSEVAAEAGVADMVEVLGAKCHNESLSYLAGADALALAGAAGDGADLQIPNKLFEYLAVRKPIIAALSPGSPARRILDEAQADAFVCEPGDEAAMANALVRVAWQRPSDASGFWTGVSRFDRAVRAAELVDVFTRVIRGRARERAGTPALVPAPA